MTIARDPRTGAVLGQVLTEWPTAEQVQLDEGRYGHTAAWRFHGYTLLARDGRYVTVPRSSVRLEELR